MAEAVKATNPKLNVEPLTQPFPNPRPFRIDEMFAFLDMKKPSHAISWRKAGNKAVRDSLDAPVRTRDYLAHGETGVKVSKGDVSACASTSKGSPSHSTSSFVSP